MYRLANTSDGGLIMAHKTQMSLTPRLFTDGDDPPSAEELAKFQAEHPISKEEIRRANDALAIAIKQPPPMQPRIELVEEDP